MSSDLMSSVQRVDFPIDPDYMPFYDLYTDITRMVWRHEEVLGSNDRAAFKKIDPRVRGLYIVMLKLLERVDNIVGAHWNQIVPEYISSHFVIDSIRIYIEFIEREHAFTYKKFITEFIDDPKEREEIFVAFETFKPIQDLINYSRKYITKDGYKYGLLGNLFLEHVLLPMVFAFVGWTAEKSADNLEKRVPGFINANTFVMKDEATHANFAFMVLKKWPELIPDISETASMAADFMIFIENFNKEAFEGSSLPSINENILNNVAKCQINNIFTRLYGRSGPYETDPMPGFLLSNNVEKRDSQFELNSADYTRSKVSDWKNAGNKFVLSGEYIPAEMPANLDLSFIETISSL